MPLLSVDVCGRCCVIGAVVGSVGSVDVVDAPSQRVECGEGAVVGSVGSVDVVDAPSQRVGCNRADRAWNVGKMS